VLTIQKTLSVFSTVAAVLLANLGLAQVDPRWKPNDPLRPTPAVITPGAASTQDSSGRPPSDAVVLFDRKDLSPWVGEDGQAAKWKLSDGYLEVLPHSGYIHTRQPFGDCQLHVEFAEPVPAVGEGQDRGKSTTASKWQAPPDAGVLSLVNQGIEPRHYVFPACENCHVDPTTPQKSWRSAWSGREDLNLRPPGPEPRVGQIQVLHSVSLRSQQAVLLSPQLYQSSTENPCG